MTSPVAAIQLAAGACFSTKKAFWHSTSPIAANQLAAGAFFVGENGHPGFDKPCCCCPASPRPRTPLEVDTMWVRPRPLNTAAVASWLPTPDKLIRWGDTGCGDCLVAQDCKSMLLNHNSVGLNFTYVGYSLDELNISLLLAISTSGPIDHSHAKSNILLDIPRRAWLLSSSNQ